MLMKFEKWHGLGNDFVIVDQRTGPHAKLNPASVRALADRRLGVGCDQVLVLVDPPPTSNATAAVEIWNADGSVAQQCGNGMRCVAAHLAGKVDLPFAVSLHTAAGLIHAEVLGSGRVKVNMGQPNFDPASLPFLTQTPGSSQQLALSSTTVSFNVVSMGNPHAVLRVSSAAEAAVDAWGTEIGEHASFPEGVNVGFMQVDARDRIELRVFERGAGETQACGSGASAAVAVGTDEGWLEGPVTVSLPGGKLVVQWPGAGHGVTMIGPASFVYTGEIEV